MGSIIASSRFGKQYTQQPITITITIMITSRIGIEKSHPPAEMTRARPASQQFSLWLVSPTALRGWNMRFGENVSVLCQIVCTHDTRSSGAPTIMRIAASIQRRPPVSMYTSQGWVPSDGDAYLDPATSSYWLAQYEMKMSVPARFMATMDSWAMA